MSAVGHRDPEVTYRAVTSRGFPDGLRCAGACNRVIEPGQPYESRPTGIDDAGNTYSVLTCVYCTDR